LTSSCYLGRARKHGTRKNWVKEARVVNRLKARIFRRERERKRERERAKVERRFYINF
jgi:hypothetical protein